MSCVRWQTLWTTPTLTAWIHRDIKPANVMIDTAGRRQDHGFRASGADQRRTHPHAYGDGDGKRVEYMAPEQIRGGTLDGRADQFALWLWWRTR